MEEEEEKVKAATDDDPPSALTELSVSQASSYQTRTFLEEEEACIGQSAHCRDSH